eukprot:TRINITY_DN18012_c0_g2_i3.p1 TRINITY_DN18012_c0_g2~~TRINITY_DN18012_c0_g2_i3.p1  ORF type:complete len:353 (-),score=99.74 TRINITY_DN18012_c0_g2_i3:10-1032(-)
MHSIMCLKSLQGVHCNESNHLSVEPSTRCYTTSHLIVAPFMWFVLCAFCAGFPVVCFWWTLKAYRSGFDHKLANMYGFLYRGLRPVMFWFRIVPMLINMLLAVEKVYFTNQDLADVLNGSVFLVNFGFVLATFPFTTLGTNLVYAVGNVLRVALLLYLLREKNQFFFPLVSLTGLVVLLLGGRQAWRFRDLLKKHLKALQEKWTGWRERHQRERQQKDRARNLAAKKNGWFQEAKPKEVTMHVQADERGTPTPANAAIVTRLRTSAGSSPGNSPRALIPPGHDAEMLVLPADTPDLEDWGAEAHADMAPGTIQQQLAEKDVVMESKYAYPPCASSSPKLK